MNFDDDDSNSPIKKRQVYSEGGSSGKKAKLTSVHRLILLCIVPQVKETYENMKILFYLTKINNISFKFVCDFKLLLIVNGQQTATLTYPSPYCFVTLKDLRKNEEENDSNKQNGEESNSNEQTEEGDISSDQNHGMCDDKGLPPISSECMALRMEI